jgi:hypothetical protein
MSKDAEKEDRVSKEDKAVAAYIAKAFGGKWDVHEYNHDDLPLSIDILSAPNRPVRGVTSYATLGLFATPMQFGKKEFPTRVEIVGACASKEKAFPNVLAAAAFAVMRTQYLIYPGACMPEYVAEFIPKTKVPHLYFTSPFLWEDKLRELKQKSRTINFLLAFGISEAELVFLNDKGDDALEDLFEEKQIDIFNAYRKSAI